jgi:hypothetical protein
MLPGAVQEKHNIYIYIYIRANRPINASWRLFNPVLAKCPSKQYENDLLDGTAIWSMYLHLHKDTLKDERSMNGHLSSLKGIPQQRTNFKLFSCVAAETITAMLHEPVSNYKGTTPENPWVKSNANLTLMVRFQDISISIGVNLRFSTTTWVRGQGCTNKMDFLVKVAYCNNWGDIQHKYVSKDPRV